MTERRNPARQRVTPDGRRTSDPSLTTRDCADRLCVTTGFIVGEIRDGRLGALVLQREGKRAIYRVSEDDLNEYKARYRWNG